MSTLLPVGATYLSPNHEIEVQHNGLYMQARKKQCSGCGQFGHRMTANGCPNLYEVKLYKFQLGAVSLQNPNGELATGWLAGKNRNGDTKYFRFRWDNEDFGVIPGHAGAVDIPRFFLGKTFDFWKCEDGGWESNGLDEPELALEEIPAQ